MLKKWFAIVFTLLAFTLGTVMAYEYPEYLNGDPHYRSMYPHMGGSSFLKTDSVKVVSQNQRYIELKATMASAQVLDRNGNLIYPAKASIYSATFRRWYSDPWNIVYVYGRDGWNQLDLSDEVGYKMSSIITFANMWYIATGTTYPNLGKYTNY